MTQMERTTQALAIVKALHALYKGKPYDEFLASWLAAARRGGYPIIATIDHNHIVTRVSPDYRAGSEARA